MKQLFTFFILFFTLINADEVQRIETIVNEISKLRSDYTRVQSNVVEMEVKLEEEKEKNKILHQDVKLYKTQILSLENKIKSLNNSIKLKEKKKIVKKIVVVKKYLNYQTLDDNKFPPLVMKEQYKTAMTDPIAFTYRVKKDSSIYDGVNGLEITVWEKNTSFTSNEKTEQWIKITGYFVNKVWRASTKDMWIKSSDALKREK